MTQPAPPFRPTQRGKAFSPSDFFSDAELRDKALLELRTVQMRASVEARKLAIMTEHKERTEMANAITRDRR